ncbi:MAG: dUTP diphosphatase [Clostridia bacterium]|nr:dUTP diphosphatase [Clostridia bacterium]
MIKFKLLSPAAKVPAYATPGASACDLCAAVTEPVVIPAGEIRLLPTGLAIDGAPDDVTILLFARSGLAVKHGIALANGVGVVDADYRGEIKVGLINQSHDDYTVLPGDRIAQMMFVPILRPSFTVTDELSATERGDGGFGHTGRS